MTFILSWFFISKQYFTSHWRIYEGNIRVHAPWTNFFVTSRVSLGKLYQSIEWVTPLFVWKTMDPPLPSLFSGFTILSRVYALHPRFHFAHVTTISLVSSVALRAPRKVKRPMVICPTYVLHTLCSKPFDACVWNCGNSSLNKALFTLVNVSLRFVCIERLWCRKINIAKTTQLKICNITFVNPIRSLWMDPKTAKMCRWRKRWRWHKVLTRLKKCNWHVTKIT